MSDRVEERHQQQVFEQKKQQDVRTAKEKTAAAEKFKTAIASNLVGKQLQTSHQQKKQGEGQQAGKQQQQGQAQNALLARNGINRTQVEGMLKKQDESGKTADRELRESRDKDISSDSDKRDVENSDSKQDSKTQNNLESPIQRRDDEKKDQQGQGNKDGQSQGQGQGQGGGNSNQGDGKQREHRDGDGLSGVGGAKASGKTKAPVAAQGSADAGKVVVGKSEKMAAKERIPPAMLQAMVDKIHEHSQHGMNEFQIQLKDDILGGGSIRVTMAGGKMKVAFTMKDASAKNLLESSKGKLMRMFEMKGLALESLEVKLRGQ